MTPYKGTVTAGALIRRQYRATLDTYGIQYTEHKGLLDSIFVITVRDEQDQERINRIQKRYDSV